MTIMTNSYNKCKKCSNEHILKYHYIKDMFIATFLAFIVGIGHYGHIDAKGALFVILKTTGFFAFYIILSKTSKKLIDWIVDVEHTDLFVILILSIIVLSAGGAATNWAFPAPPRVLS